MIISYVIFATSILFAAHSLRSCCESKPAFTSMNTPSKLIPASALVDTQKVFEKTYKENNPKLYPVDDGYWNAKAVEIAPVTYAT